MYNIWIAVWFFMVLNSNAGEISPTAIIQLMIFRIACSQLFYQRKCYIGQRCLWGGVCRIYCITTSTMPTIIFLICSHLGHNFTYFNQHLKKKKSLGGAAQIKNWFWNIISRLESHPHTHIVEYLAWELLTTFGSLQTRPSRCLYLPACKQLIKVYGRLRLTAVLSSTHATFRDEGPKHRSLYSRS